MKSDVFTNLAKFAHKNGNKGIVAKKAQITTKY